MPRLVIENFDRGMTRDFPLKGSETVYTKKGEFGELTPGTTFTGCSPLSDPNFLVPSLTASDIDASEKAAVTTKCTAGDISSSINAYLIGGTLLYRLQTADYTTITNNTPTTPVWPHTITNAVETAGDMHDIKYTLQDISGTNTRVLLYSYNVTAGGGYLGRFDITNYDDWATGSSADDFSALSTNDILDDDGSASIPRPMVMGTNKYLYIGSGYKIDSIDLATASSTVVTNVLDTEKEFEIQSVAFWNDQLVIATRRKNYTATNRSRVAVYFWDTIASTYSNVIYIDDDECGALFADGDTLRLFTSGAVYGTLRQWDGFDFVEIQQTNKQIPAHGNIDQLRGGMIWGDSTGKAWFYGKTGKSNENRLWNFTSVGDNLTLVKRLASASEKIHFCGSVTTTEFIRSFGTSYQTSEIMLPVFDIPNRSTITRVEAQFVPLSTGASMSFSLHKNMAYNSSSYGSISYTADGGSVSHKVWKSRITDISQLVIGMAWAAGDNAVKIERLIIDYDTPKTKSSS